MRTLLKILSLYCSMLLAGPGLEFLDWKQPETLSKSILNNSLPFQNSAECAYQSKFPTTKVFQIHDLRNFSKASYRIGLKLGLSEEQNTKRTETVLKKYHKIWNVLFESIVQKIFEKKLPLLSSDKVSNINELSEACNNGNCQELNSVIKTLWGNAASITKTKVRSSCHVLNQMKHEMDIGHTKPSLDRLQILAQDLIQSKKSEESCDDVKTLNEQISFIEWEIFPYEDFKKWNNEGHDVWFSIQNYLSWAMRYSSEMEKLAGTDLQLFKALNINESVVFFSADCRSILPATCRQDEFLMSDISDLFINLDQKKIEQLYSETVSPNAKDLYKENFQPSAEDLQTYKPDKNLEVVKTIGNIKNYSQKKFLASDTFFKRFMESVPESLDFKDDFFGTKRLCTEFMVAFAPGLGTFNTQVKQPDSEILKRFVEVVIPKVLAACSEWEKTFTAQDPELDKTKSMIWLEEVKTGNFFNDALKDELNLYEQELNRSQEEFCQDMVLCLRLSAKAAIDAIKFLHLKTLLLPSQNTFSEYQVFSPLRPEVACKAYNPQKKINFALKNLGKDSIYAFVLGLSPIPVYVDFDIKQKKVASIEEIIKSGEINYKPKFSRKKNPSVLLDMQKIIGLPCALSVTGEQNAFSFFFLEGINFQYCSNNTKSTTQVTEIDQSQNDKSLHSCITCSINLRAALNAIPNIAPQVKVGLYLLRGLIRFTHTMIVKNDNFRKKWEVSQTHLLLAKSFYGTIPKTCEKKLLKGKGCLPSKCMNTVLPKVYEAFPMTIEQTYFDCDRHTAYLKIKECKKYVTVNFEDKNNMEIITKDRGCE